MGRCTRLFARERGLRSRARLKRFLSREREREEEKTRGGRSNSSRRAPSGRAAFEVVRRSSACCGRRNLFFCSFFIFDLLVSPTRPDAARALVASLTGAQRLARVEGREQRVPVGRVHRLRRVHPTQDTSVTVWRRHPMRRHARLLCRLALSRRTESRMVGRERRELSKKKHRVRAGI